MPFSLESTEKINKKINKWLAPIFLLGAILGFLGRGTLAANFVVLDDPYYVTANPMVRQGFSWDGIQWAFNTTYYGNWFPLTWMSYMLDCQLFGTNPVALHATNLFLHLVATLFFYWFLSRSTRQLWLSTFAALLFAVHPLHVEPVVWISSRKDVLSGAFWMLTLLAYQLYVSAPSKKRYILFATTFLFALAAKPNTIVLPVLLLVLDFWLFHRAQNRAVVYKLILEKLPLFAASTTLALATILSQGSAGPDLEAGYLSLSRRVSNSLVYLTTYLQRTLFPTNLSIHYPHPLDTYSTTLIALSGTALTLVTVLLFLYRKKSPTLLVGWLWFGIALTPNLQITQIGNQATADRYMYASLAGLCILFAWALSAVVNKLAGSRELQQWIFGIVVVFTTITLGFCSTNQLSHWQTSERIFQHTIAVTKANHRAHAYLGDSYAAHQDWANAAESYKEALRLNPFFYLAFTRLAQTLKKLGIETELANSVPAPTVEHALSFQQDVALGNMLFQLGKFQPAAAAYMARTGHSAAENAVTHLDRSIRTKPGHRQSIESAYTLGVLYLQLGQFENAAIVLQTVATKQPKRASSRTLLALALIKLGQVEDAKLQVEEALTLEPDNRDALALSKKIQELLQ